MPGHDAFTLVDRSAQPTLEPTIEVQTVVGPLLLPREDRIITSVLEETGVWEIAETCYLEATLRLGQTFVDVGAHVGYFSVLAARRVGRRGTVIAVEPEPRNLDLLHRNLARSGCGTVRVMPFAAAAETGSMLLALDEHNRGAHRLVAAGDLDGRVPVRCVRLDEVLPVRVDAIKIDAQGFDHEVVEGLARTLERNPRAIVLVELSPHELARRAIAAEAVLARYEVLDFTLSMFDEARVLRRASVDEVLARAADPSSRDFTVVLARPASPPFTPASRPARAAGLEVADDADGLTITQAATGRLHRLNPTAALVFDLCTGANSVASIVQLVQRAFELDDPPRAAVEGCLERLRREDVVS